MRTRIFADLNPAYPSKGERRWAIFMCHQGQLTRFPDLSFASRRSAERNACRLQVEHALASLGIVICAHVDSFAVHANVKEGGLPPRRSRK